MSTEAIATTSGKTIQICEENRFSRFVKGSRDSIQFQALLRWQQWFIRRGIGAIINKSLSGYALYREGLIDIPLQDDVICAYKPCSIEFKVYPDHPQKYCSKKCQQADRLWGGQ